MGYLAVLVPYRFGEKDTGRLAAIKTNSAQKTGEEDNQVKNAMTETSRSLVMITASNAKT